MDQKTSKLPPEPSSSSSMSKTIKFIDQGPKATSPSKQKVSLPPAPPVPGPESGKIKPSSNILAKHNMPPVRVSQSSSGQQQPLQPPTLAKKSSTPPVMSTIITSKMVTSESERETSINISQGKSQTKIQISEKRSPKNRHSIKIGSGTDPKSLLSQTSGTVPKSSISEMPSGTIPSNVPKSSIVTVPPSGTSNITQKSKAAPSGIVQQQSKFVPAPPPLPVPKQSTVRKTSSKKKSPKSSTDSQSFVQRVVKSIGKHLSPRRTKPLTPPKSPIRKSTIVPAQVAALPERSKSIQQKFFVKPFNKPVIASTNPSYVQQQKNDVKIWVAPPSHKSTTENVKSGIHSGIESSKSSKKLDSTLSATSEDTSQGPTKSPAATPTSSTKQSSAEKISIVREVRQGQSPGEKIETIRAKIVQKVDQNKKSRRSKREEFMHDCTIFVLTQMLALTILILIAGLLMKYFGGFGYNNSYLIFNLHPMLMVLGMIYIMANTLLFLTPKRNINSVRFIIFLVMIGLIGLATVCTIYYHFKREMFHLFTLHSWFGLATLIMLVVYVGTVLRYYGPRDSSVKHLEDALDKIRLFGIVTLIMATITVLIGLNQMEIFIINLTDRSPQMLINCIGVFLIVYVTFMIYMVSRRRTRSRKRDELEERVQQAVDQAMEQMEARGAFDSPSSKRTSIRKSPSIKRSRSSRKSVKSVGRSPQSSPRSSPGKQRSLSPARVRSRGSIKSITR